MLKITDIRCEQQKNALQAATCKGTKENNHLYCNPKEGKSKCRI